MTQTSPEALPSAPSSIKPLTASILRAMLTLPLGAQAKELAALVHCDVEQVRRTLRAAKAQGLVDVEPSDRTGPAEWFLLPDGRERLRQHELENPSAIAPVGRRYPPSLPNVPNSVFALGAFAQ
jgi:hypothetical protein